MEVSNDHEADAENLFFFGFQVVIAGGDLNELQANKSLFLVSATPKTFLWPQKTQIISKPLLGFAACAITR